MQYWASSDGKRLASGTNIDQPPPGMREVTEEMYLGLLETLQEGAEATRVAEEARSAAERTERAAKVYQETGSVTLAQLVDPTWRPTDGN